MISIILSFILWIKSGIAATSSDPTEKAPIFIGQGEQRLLTIPSLNKYSLGSNNVRILPLSPRLLQTSAPSKERLLLKGISPGTSDLWVWKSDGSSEHRTIHVAKISDDGRNLELERALGQLNEVEVILSGRGVTLRGTVHQISECAKIASLLRNYSKEVQDETELSEELIHSSFKRISNWIETSGYLGKLRIERLGKSLWIRGNLESPAVRSSIEKQLRSLFPLLQTELEALPDLAPTVHFRVFLLELKRSQFHSLGLTWPSSIGTSFQVTPSGLQTSFQMDLALQQLEGDGFAKILSNPELVVRAPGEAELFAGGELPIQMKSRYTSNVTWKNYGLTLRLKVAHVSGDRVRLDIFTEVSHLDTRTSDDKVPGIQANRMKTQVDARFGTPLFLSGLLQHGMREEAKGLPFLRQIPILGRLFGSEDYLNEQSELVALLYPHSNLPPAPIRKIQRYMPLGPIPPPRNWSSPREERILRESKDFPWNTLE